MGQLEWAEERGGTGGRAAGSAQIHRRGAQGGSTTSDLRIVDPTIRNSMIGDLLIVDPRISDLR
ncbi:hypothetical protein [Promicromonospora sp. NPDC090134]|uniref:hypothetical protein n=1 Tax=Promicromonospora sp. NPDC090134 TaxID=3364408 RepID=UPI0037F9C53A